MKCLKMKTAEEILKGKLDMKIAIVNNPDYTFNKIIEAMEEYAEQQFSTMKHTLFERNQLIQSLEKEIENIRT